MNYIYVSIMLSIACGLVFKLQMGKWRCHKKQVKKSNGFDKHTKLGIIFCGYNLLVHVFQRSSCAFFKMVNGQM